MRVSFGDFPKGSEAGAPASRSRAQRALLHPSICWVSDGSKASFPASHFYPWCFHIFPGKIFQHSVSGSQPRSKFNHGKKYKPTGSHHLPPCTADLLSLGLRSLFPSHPLHLQSEQCAAGACLGGFFSTEASCSGSSIVWRHVKPIRL